MTYSDYLSAMEKRCSRRKYTDTPIENENAEALRRSIASCNKASGLNMKLIH